MGKKRLRIPDSAVQQDIPEDNRLLEFSFKHLDFSNSKFNKENCDSDYLCSLLLCVKKYSNYTVGQFTDFNYQLDRHTIDPEILRKQLAHQIIDEQLLDSEAWTFTLEPNETRPPKSSWRAHGLRIGNTFYIVWLDPQHKLFESKHPKYKQASARK